MFSNRTIIITGAGKGIGRAICNELVKENAKLVIAITRSKEDCESLEKEMNDNTDSDNQNSKRLVALQCDLGDLKDLDKTMRYAIDEILKKQHNNLPLNNLINNAGIARLEPLLSTSFENWDATMRVNAYAPLRCTQIAAEYMLESLKKSKKESGSESEFEASIVNISSVASQTALQNHTSYCMSKSSVDMLTKMCALELAPSQIRVNSVNPTVVLTKMGKENWSDPEKGGPLLKQIPMGRFVEESEVVKPVMFLLDSRQSGMINGQSILIEGGLLGTTKL